ncbi:MAG: hypothetical protein KatS3mg102_1519 [Planctomycetota bacterium]|nr:MAG: hypothetical protein KatS3mg102_1519 [Planctomycetota bacterium]
MSEPTARVSPAAAPGPEAGPAAAASAGSVPATSSGRLAAQRPLLPPVTDGAALLEPLLQALHEHGLVRAVLGTSCDGTEVLGFANPQRHEPPRVLYRDEGDGAVGRALLARMQRLAGMVAGRPPHPLSGSFTLELGGRPREYELVVVPAVRGEQAALLVRDTTPGLDRPLAQLGFLPGDLARVRAMLAAASGFIALVGDPGNGKSTLCRAIIAEQARAGRRVVAVERGVETPRRDAVVIRPPHGDAVPHEAWVDAALQLVPEVAVFDDLPGRAACARAVRGALDGVLVVYALELADAVGAARYLDELPLRPGFVAAALQGVIGVRLVREACALCKKPVPLPLELTATVATVLGETETEPKWCEGEGCPTCHHTGTTRLRTLFEVAVLEDEARRRLIENPSAYDLASLLATTRADSIRAQALRLAAEGVIPVSEL